MTAKKRRYRHNWRSTARMWDLRYRNEVHVAEPSWAGNVKILKKKTRQRERKPYGKRKVGDMSVVQTEGSSGAESMPVSTKDKI